MKSNKKLYCYVLKPSYWFLEGNINTYSIYGNLIKVFDKLFNLNLKINKSYNSKESNMKIKNVPCIFYNGKFIGRESIYFFFLRTLSYAKLPLLKEENEKFISNEIVLLRNIILYDFQQLINYINYNTKRSNFNNFFRYIYSPIMRTKSYIEDVNIIHDIEYRYHINNKKQAMNCIKNINDKIEYYLQYLFEINNINVNSHVNNIDIDENKEEMNNLLNENGNKIQINSFLILIYTCFLTQKQFFSEKKKAKMKLDSYKNINYLCKSIEEFIEKRQSIPYSKFDPDEYFNKAEVNEDEKMDLEDNESNGSIIINSNKQSNKNICNTAQVGEFSEEKPFRMRKFILQIFGFGACFYFIYYIRLKRI